MELIQYENKYFPSLLDHMKKAVVQEFRNSPELIKILEYHFSWNQVPPNKKSGKKIRPLMLLLTMEALGARWQKGIASASAVEFLHNYSLIHDDIEDRDEIRHGRQTVWKKYGIPQAINTGDALYGLAFAELGGIRIRIRSEKFSRNRSGIIQVCNSSDGWTDCEILVLKTKLKLNWMTIGKW